MPQLVSEVRRLLDAHGVSWGRALFSASDESRAAALRRALRQHGLDPSRVVSDTVSFAPWVARGAYDDGVSKAVSSCGCCVNLGAPRVAINGDRAFKRAVISNVRRARKLRDRQGRKGGGDGAGGAGGRKISVFVWTVDDWKEMVWLSVSGVDGVITNRPDLLSGVVGAARKVGAMPDRRRR